MCCVKRRAVEVALQLEHRQPLVHRAARGDPAHAQAAADGLRQRVDVDHVRGRQRPQRARLGAIEAQVAVHAVLEHHQVALARERGQPLTALVRQVAPGGVLAAGLERDQLHLVPADQLLERVDVQAVFVHRDADHAGARGAQRPRAARRGGGLDRHHVAVLQQPRTVRSIACCAPEVTMISSGSRGEAHLAAARGQLLAQVVEPGRGEVGEGVDAHLVDDVAR